MRNVVNFTTNKKPKIDEAQEFITMFYDWSRDHGIDTSTTEFKFDAAIILTTVQALIHERG